MRIAFFVWEYPPRLVGGLGTYAQNMAPEMVAQGHDVSLFTVNPGDLKTHEVMQGVDVHRPLPVNMMDVFPIVVAEDLRRWGKQLEFFSSLFAYNLLSASKLVRELVQKEGHQYDLVCAHDWLSAPAGMTVQRELKLPFVLHMHSTEWGRAMGTGSDTVRHIEDTAGKAADRVVTVSYPMEEDLVRHGWDASKVRVVWNGIDPDRYSPQRADPGAVAKLRERYGVRDREKMVLFVGRLTSVKGAVQLVQAMPTVLTKHPDAKLVVLGAGELDRTVTGLVKTLNLEKSVKTNFQFVPEEERILHYAACDLAVLPSLYEPFGIVSLEAMSMEKPVVVGASGLSGFRDQVIPSGDNQTGVHVDGNNPSDIAWGIGALLEDPDRAREMGKRSRQRVLQYFTWKQAAKNTLEVYQEAAESK
ncbi:MAG: glycosyltransferase family 4 protein [Euryarchaeota archaeon]|nr:glycosyltransferase family 4 protein [Euryarchaeota archaeon]